jgi:superfamily II DNA/RNA helicase
MVKANRQFSEFGLDKQLLKALNKLELESTTAIQAEVLPIALNNKDVLVSAETGSGKTIAYLLPILQKILQNAAPDTATRCLILAPTRELAEQIDSDCKALCQFSQVSSLCLIGGLSFKEQKALIRKNPEILIATPGRILEHLNKSSVDLSDLEFLVLDEADRMLDMGLRDDVLAVCQACNTRRQTFLLSATLQHGEAGNGIQHVAGEILQEAVYLSDGTYRQSKNNITQKIILADSVEHKKNLLVKLLEKETSQKTLIFTNTRDQAMQLNGFLQYKKLNTAYLHGELSQEDRKKVLQLFKNGKINVLLATDLAGRGLDISDLDLVINFDMARSADDYLHRIGRTGRAGDTGTAISLINANDWNLSQSIARYLKIEFETIRVKGLEAKFKGKVGRKSDKKSRAAQAGKAKSSDKDSSKARLKAKQRQRNQKNIGKRRKPSAETSSTTNDGLSPLKRK